MNRFNLNKLNDVEVKEQYQVKFQTDLQFWRIWMIMWISVGLGRILKYQNFSQREPKLLHAKAA
jgi:hypothetical protein